MKKLWKPLVLILSVALVIGALTMIVSAEGNVAKVGDTEYATLAEALDAAPADATVTLLADVTVSETYTLTKNVTIDLGGKTLTTTVSEAFIEETDGLSFSIVGNGKIEAAGRVVRAEKTDAYFAIIGDEKGITINHSATKSGGLVQANGGTYRFENFTLTSDSQYIILSIGDNSKVDLINLNVKAEKGNKDSKCFINASGTSTIHMSYCRVVTMGTSIFGIGSHDVRNEDFLTVKSSVLEAKYHATNKSSAHVFYNGYGSCASDIVVEDSYLNANTRLNIKFSVNQSALILRNTTYCYNGMAGTFFRDFNVKLEEGSSLIGTHQTYADQTKILGSEFYGDPKEGNPSPLVVGDNTNVNMIISEGARFDAGAYKKLVSRIGSYVDSSGADVEVEYYADGQVVFPDGSSPYNSETYGFVYDPAGNPGAPYVLVKIEEGASLPKMPDLGTLITYDANASALGAYNGVSTYGNISYLMAGECGMVNNTAWRYISNGAINSNGKAPNFFFGKKGGVNQELYNVFVTDFDIGADIGGGFVPTNISMHQRNDNLTSGDKNRSISFLILDEDGTIKGNALKIADAEGTLVASEVSLKLNVGEWAHVTIVTDTTPNRGMAYVYVNGTYMGQKQGYTADDAYIFGPRFDVTMAGAKTIGNSLYMDNVNVRAYGDLSVEGAEQVEVNDLGASYLIGGGKAWNSGAVGNAVAAKVANVAFADVEEAIAASASSGVTVSLNKNIGYEQTVVSEGKIYANGYEISLSEESLSANVIYDGDKTFLYDFSKKYSSYVNFEFFFGDFKDAAQLADPAYWTEAVKCGIGKMPSDVYSGGAIANNLTADAKGYYGPAPHIGWSLTPGGEEFNAPLSLEYAEANNGTTVKLYPTYDANKINYYAFVVLDKDGNFSRGFNHTEWYGSKIRPVRIAYGETLKLQKDIYSQVAMSNFWDQDSKDASAADKTINIDFSGHTVIFDMNYAQTYLANFKFGSVINVGLGETYNVYSSRPGAKVAAYGINGSSKNISTETYTVGDANIPAKSSKIENGVVTIVNHKTDTTTKIVTVTTTEYTIKGASGGVLFNLSGGTANDILSNANGETTNHNSHLNVGTVTVRGVTYPGSNLSVEGCCIANAQHGDSTCSLNIDGVKITRSSADYPGMFIARRYFGEFNVTNCTIVNPLGSNLVCGHSEGYRDENDDKVNERALSKFLFENCVIVVKSDGGSLISDTHSGESITFKNCMTNGRFNNPVNTDVKVIIGEGNTYFSAGAPVAEGLVGAGYNKPMTLPNGENTITVNYFTLVPDNDFTTSGNDYIDHSYVIALYGYEGEADQVLPILPNKSTSEYVEVTFKGLGENDDVVKPYAIGGDVVAIDVADYALNALKLTHNGEWDVELPKNIEADATVTPGFDVVSNLSGLKANLSIYADFGVNIYVPIEYKEYIVSAVMGDVPMGLGDVDLDGDEVAESVKVNAKVAAKDCAGNLGIVLSIADGGYEANVAINLNVVSYASKVLALESATDADKALMYQMLTYANEAIKYAGGEANAEILALIGENTLTDYSASIGDVCDTSVLANAFAGATVDTDADLAYVLALKAGFVGTVTVKNGDSTYTFEVDENDTEIRISGMKVYNFAHDLEISAVGTVGEENVSVSGTYNLATFTKHHINNAATSADSAKCVAFAKAFYNYVMEAAAYVAE